MEIPFGWIAMLGSMSSESGDRYGFGDTTSGGTLQATLKHLSNAQHLLIYRHPFFSPIQRSTMKDQPNIIYIVCHDLERMKGYYDHGFQSSNLSRFTS